MDFFIVISFIMSNVAIDRPVYIFKEPNFDNKQICELYVRKYEQRLIMEAGAAYDFELNPEAIFCITKEQVEEIFKYNNGKKNI
jgi:hypothetical protein